MTQTSVRLMEWQSCTPEPGAALDGVFLEDDGSRTLAKLLTESGMLEVTELRAGLSLKSSSFVGRIELGNIQVTVTPKIKGNSLLRLLRYAYGLRDLELFSWVGYDAQTQAL